MQITITTNNTNPRPTKKTVRHTADYRFYTTGNRGVSKIVLPARKKTKPQPRTRTVVYLSGSQAQSLVRFLKESLDLK